MKIHYLQHAPFEGLGSMEGYLQKQGHHLASTQMYLGEKCPSVDDLDMLIVMGGPMGIYDEIDYPWLSDEKCFLKEAIIKGKVVLGICLGAQLLADALGAKVIKNKHREIGWFPINRVTDVSQSILDKVFPENMEAFHWHGDTFDLPSGALPLASSEACQNQGFIFENRIIGFQFHLETTIESAMALIENCRGEFDGGNYVQTEEELLADGSKFIAINHVMHSVLSVLERNIAEGR